MKNADLILTPKWLVTVDKDDTVLTDHSIVIKDNIIADILPTRQAHALYNASSTHELSNHILAPGLINTHMHTGMSLLRGYADDLPLMEWLQEHIWPAEAKWLSAEFAEDGSRLAIAESLLGGTTCLNDMYFFTESTAKVVDQSGIRACLGMTIIDFPTLWGTGPDDYLEKGFALRDQYKDHPLLTFSLAPHAPYTVSEEPLKRIRQLSESENIPVHMHIHETAGEIEQFVEQHNMRPLQRLDDLGLLNPAMIAIHMTQLNDDEIKTIAEKGVNIVHCPESNMKLASGTCPVFTLLNAGINVALGTDSTASNNDLDMFGEMRSAALLSKHVTQNAAALNAHQALRMATINGAKALGLDTITGSLETGKAADIIAIDTSELSMSPVYEPVSHLVYSASRHCVDHVWVNGKPLVKNKKLTTLNEQAITDKTNSWLDRINQATEL